MNIDIILVSKVDSAALAMNSLIIGIEVSALLLGIISVVYVGRRRQKQISTLKRIELLRYRERFNDAGNIIGLLIMQRSVGLPIFSRIIKGWFEMSLISGFISAISSFSAEIRTEEKLWTAIPISEVVIAVQTEELICTLLTVDTPSRALIKNLEEMSFQIGSKFDSNPVLLKAMGSNQDIALDYKEEFDRFFETHFDILLLPNYSSYDKSQSGQYPLIEEAIDSPELQSPFSANELVACLVASGLEERRSYALVIEAIEAGFLISEK